MIKTGLVVEGGGMKCAYNAGILDAFLDNNINFDYCIGVSGGSGNLASFLSGQRGRNIRFFTEHIHDSGYFGIKTFLKTGNLFGLDYIYNDLTNSKGKDPLNFSAILENPAEYHVVATNASTGRPEYFGKKDMAQDDYRCVMASSSIPVVCKPVKIGDFHYYDGGLTDAIPVQKALDAGCERLVVILSKPRGFVRPPQKFKFLYSKILRSYPNTVKAIENRHLVYNAGLERLYRLEKEGVAYIFAPPPGIKVSTYTMDEKIEWQLYHMGLKDFAQQQTDLDNFLTSEHLRV